MAKSHKGNVQYSWAFFSDASSWSQLRQDGKLQKRKKEDGFFACTEFFHLFLRSLCYKARNALMSWLHNRNICLVHRRIVQAAYLHLLRYIPTAFSKDLIVK